MCAGKEKIQRIEEEERALKEENMRLQRRLLRETERREQMTRQLSESESSLEMDEERCVQFIVLSKPLLLIEVLSYQIQSGT